ncbi:MAG: SdpI family protein [Candidatus Micrarchaeota archaeon]
MRRNEILILLFALLFLAIGAYFYPQMPDRMADHWNAQGEANGYTDTFWGVFLVPLMAIAITLMLLAVPRIDPLKKNIEKFRGHYEGFMFVFLLYMLAVYLQIILWNMGNEISFNITMPIGIGLLFIYLGFLFDKIKKNWFIGIRTPWTLSSDRVWEKTHKLGAALFKLSGMIALMGIFVPEYYIWMIIVPIIASSIGLSLYSYFEYRKEVKK